MPIEGCDYSYSRPSAAQLKAAGKRFACRYVSTPGHAKNLTAAEARELKAAGVGIVLVGEISAGRAMGGFAQGKTDMASFRAQARDLGAPDPSCIYLAVDFDAITSQMSTVVAYVQGGAAVAGQRWTGVYGSYAVVEACRAAAACHYFWQTYAWSGGRLHPAAQLYQYRNGVALGSGQVDLDRAYADDYGQWGAQAAAGWWVTLGTAELDQLESRLRVVLG